MTTEISDIAYEFRQRFSATARGARLARHLVAVELIGWGVPYADDVELVVGELAANAVRHGRVPGRDFEVLVRYDGQDVRVEVADSRGESGPVRRAVDPWSAEGGRGLLIVAALAVAWGVGRVVAHRPQPGLS